MEVNKISECFSAIQRVSEVADIELPCFDIAVAAGLPLELDGGSHAERNNLLQMLVPHPESSYLIGVKGDSMIDAGIYSGDVVVIDRSLRNPNENEIAMCEHNGEYTIKYVRCHDGKTWLVPDNIDFPEREIKEGDTFNVWGVVVLVIHKATRRR